MTPEQIFSFANMAALAAWLLLAVFPRRPFITDVVVGTAVPVALAAAYTSLVATFWLDSQGGFSSLSEVGMLFSNPWMLLAGWLHYLAFDLLVGRWELADAQQRGIHYLLVLPCLALTFLFGPAGWLLYQGVRTAGDRGR